MNQIYPNLDQNEYIQTIYKSVQSDISKYIQKLSKLSQIIQLNMIQTDKNIDIHIQIESKKIQI